MYRGCLFPPVIAFALAVGRTLGRGLSRSLTFPQAPIQNVLVNQSYFKAGLIPSACFKGDLKAVQGLAELAGTRACMSVLPMQMQIINCIIKATEIQISSNQTILLGYPTGLRGRGLNYTFHSPPYHVPFTKLR